MNSCIYECLVMHNRLEPKPNRFHYNVFMFYLDLDEIDTVIKSQPLISRDKFNFFTYKDSDHLHFNESFDIKGNTIKEKITDYIGKQGIDLKGGRIMLMTNLRTLGYVFNPVSFYYCYNNFNKLECVVVEVCNTFREMKLYFLGPERLVDGRFHLNTTKYFYVSPFVELDTNFDFNLNEPTDKLNIRIDDFKNEKRFFISTLTGIKKELSQANILYYSLKFPFITLKIIVLIHWQALKLWLKRIPFHAKGANIHLQKEILNPNKA